MTSHLRLRAALAAATMAALAGCAIGPDYERPADAMPADEFRGVLTPQQAQSIFDLNKEAVMTNIDF